MLLARRSALTAGAAVALALSFSSAQSQMPADPPGSLRSSEAVLETRPHAELAVVRDGASWHSTLSGNEADVRKSGNSVRVAFPSGVGGFHGTLSDDGRSITGFWVQPPDGTRQPFATPLVLQLASVNAWRGIVQPLVIDRAPSGASASLPRPPGGPTYEYRPPQDTGDGWTPAHSGEVGIDESALTRLVRGVIDSDPTSRRRPLIHSILVARHGKLVLEEYFFGFDRETPHDLRSAGKTFASVMLGAAMMNGAKLDPETRLYDLVGTMGPFANPDLRKTRITLGELMTHTSGLACDDNDDASPGSEDRMQHQTGQPDWWKYTLDLPVAHDPGTRYAYCSAGMNLVGAALTTSTRTSLPELFARTVAEPLQFGVYHWNLMPTGEGYLGGGAFVRPRDLLKLGQTYLDGGVWRGRRIVEAAWVKASTAPRVHISPATTGLAPDRFSESYLEADDGYAWHLNTLRSSGRSYGDYEAVGNGGQFLIVVPALDLVVVLTGGNYGQGGIWLRWRDDIVAGQIVRAMTN